MKLRVFSPEVTATRSNCVPTASSKLADTIEVPDKVEIFIESTLTESPLAELVAFNPQLSLESVGCTVTIEKDATSVIPVPSVTKGIGSPYVPPEDIDALEVHCPLLGSTMI